MADQRYGVYDTVDECWMGTPDGPALYDDPILARIAAQVIADSMGIADWRRLEMRSYDGSGIKLRDEVPMVRTPLESLNRLERGEVWRVSRKPRRRISRPQSDES